MTTVAVPKTLMCPITLELFESPMQASDGFTYEKTAIETMMTNDKTNISKSPVTGAPLTNRILVPSHTVKAMVCDFKEKEKIISKEKLKALIEKGDTKALDDCRYLEGQLEQIISPADKRTPFLIALDNQSIPMMRWLIKHDVNLNSCGYPLHRVVADGKIGCLPIIEFLLSNEGKCKTSDKDDNDNTPLFYANSVLVTELLIKHKADVNAIDDDGRTPITYCDKLEMFVVLIQAGARLDIIDQEGSLPLDHLICRNQDKRLFPFALVHALKSRNSDLCVSPLSLIGNAFENGNSFILPYVAALFEPKSEWLRSTWLKNRGILSYARNDDMEFVLDFCVSSFGLDAVKRALNHQDDDQKNAIHYWINFCVPPEVMKAGIMIGGDWKARDRYGHSGLHKICNWVHVQDKLAWSYIEIFASSMSKNEFLVEVNALDKDGKSPIDLALELTNTNSSPIVIATLISHGASLQGSAKDKLKRLGVDFMLLVFGQQAKQVSQEYLEAHTSDVEAKQMTSAQQFVLDQKQLVTFSSSSSSSSSSSGGAFHESPPLVKLLDRLAWLINSYKVYHAENYKHYALSDETEKSDQKSNNTKRRKRS
jgi:ankyrin repeat protein